MEVGTLTASNSRRRWENRITLRCDAFACLTQAGHGRPLLLASVAGPESAVKAFTAFLYDDKSVNLEARIGNSWTRGADRWGAGYKVYRAPLGYGTWHALAVAKCQGLILALSEESLWRELRSDHFTTPILRHWTPWIMRRLLATGGLIHPEQAGCQTGYLTADTDALDALVSEGVKTGELTFTTKAEGQSHAA